MVELRVVEASAKVVKSFVAEPSATVAKSVKEEQAEGTESIEAPAVEVQVSQATVTASESARISGIIWSRWQHHRWKVAATLKARTQFHSLEPKAPRWQRLERRDRHWTT